MNEREQFEAYYGIPVEHRRAPSAGGYAGRDFQLMWAAWQASRRAALEEAATLIGPKGKRPCDCDTCDCGNSGDMRAVAWWDEAKSNADRIRALAASDSDGGKS